MSDREDRRQPGVAEPAPVKRAGAPPNAADSEGSGAGTAGRSPLQVAREALAAARAEARRRGLRPGRTSAPGPGGAQGGRRRPRVVDETRSGAHPDERDPQVLGSAVDRLVSDRGWGTDAAVGGVLGRWAEIVGSEVAAHAEPLSFDDGRLVVAADSTAWATQIRLLAPTLLARLADELGAGVVTSVVVRGPSGPSWKKGRLAVPGRGPRDTYG